MRILFKLVGLAGFAHCLPQVFDDPFNYESAPSVEDVKRSINAAISEQAKVNSKYEEYSVKTVSWDDVSRYKDSETGQLSAWGDNICDTRLYAKDGTLLYTVRSDNWNEKLGTVSARDIRMLEGNQRGETLNEITLSDFLYDSAELGEYVGLQTDGLDNRKLDRKVSIRFQTTFLPVTTENQATFQFNSQMYNYASSNDEDPRNLILLASSMGVALQQDGEGTKDIFHHKVKNGEVMQYWLEAEATTHEVGGEQIEDKKQILDALSRGKTRSRPIGIAAMGKRFNAVMAIQIPLKQKNPNPSGGFLFDDFMEPMAKETLFLSISPEKGFGGSTAFGSKTLSESRKFGQSNAARVSAGSEAGLYRGLGNKTPERHDSEHITCTVSFYYTVAGGVPSPEDVIKAIDDMEKLYSSVGAGHLADEQFEGVFTTKIKLKEVVAYFRESGMTGAEVKANDLYSKITADMSETQKKAFINSF